ncbi:bifunctional 3-(3-hydroxy-phenyl)propionate/3-hydroxycinnamic acid hydroxylase [Pseudomonas citronellolis]|uniref:Bifunctional 3-(3-hydroxy-phenyl)propionate/3-hydroxycinnamic acid hydroxylase n=2 Tax=Pseudomonas citronellolis TaxID=53408 RepID=A0AAW6P8U2_9PSED|nr:bifunctional 3-(3-hydroxy-phenyl)propionate/3-hydroxycinnamic acid hydroxylase [Pseudomonas citronellolis]MDF3843519.1 bifunctional 3-(3-hydroxy-phenyl)propionate/3-hydroxycinnamic acid hydroxylase [Pseudomonas citronellolis]
METDVLVIGAGPVGLTAANLLADQGIRVTLAERNPGITDEPRAISITDESLRVMAEIGVLHKLLPEMLVGTGARYFGRKGQLLAEMSSHHSRLGQPVKSQFDQPVLVALLLEAAQARSGIDLRFGTEVRAVANHPEHAEVELVDANGAQRLRAKWVLACDGGRSPVRTQLGIPLEGSTQVEKWIVVDVLNTQGEPERFSRFHCNGVRPCVVVPGVKGRCRYEFMLLPGDDPARVTTPEFIIELVAPYQRIVAADIRRAAVYVAQQRIAASFRRGRVLLAGDAAHLMPPFAGQGLNAGIRDAANLAWKIAAHVRGQASEALIDSYQAERRPHAEQMVRLSHRIGKVVMSTHPLLTTLRDVAVVALGIVPPAKRWLVDMKFLKQPYFTTGCIVPPASDLPRAAADLVGRALPQPRVQRPNGERIALDKVLGSDWAILRFPKDAALEIQRPAGRREGVVDLDGAFAALLGSGLTLLVRPDRYVAAASRAPDEQLALQALAALIPALPACLYGTGPQGDTQPRASLAIQSRAS